MELEDTSFASVGFIPSNEEIDIKIDKDLIIHLDHGAEIKVTTDSAVELHIQLSCGSMSK